MTGAAPGADGDGASTDRDVVAFTPAGVRAGFVKALPVALGVAGASRRLPEERRSSLSAATVSSSGSSPVRRDWRPRRPSS